VLVCDRDRLLEICERILDALQPVARARPAE
jgi:hypothetical protein